MKKHSRPLMSIGISSLLLIFVSLCLFTFAVLSLVSARADYRLSAKIADRTTAYYEASGEAYHLIARLDEVLLSSYNNSQNQETFFEKLPEAFAAFPEITYDPSSRELSFPISIDDSQILSVRLQIHYPTASGDSFYAVRRWQTINISDWTPDTRQNLYQHPES